jgi:YegS/Rv2252/BmrU family lipid kinase
MTLTLAGDAQSASPSAQHQTRGGRIDITSLDPPPRLIVNPKAGYKLGMQTNAATLDAVEMALHEAGLSVQVEITHAPGHATQLARAAVADGCQLIIAAGGDGTVLETGEALVDTQATLAIMPLGSIMNMARMLCIPRNLRHAARIIAQGNVLAMDVGRVNGRLFLEAGGVGLAAGLFGYFNRLDHGDVRLRGVLRAALRFTRGIGTPRVKIVADDQRFDVRAPMVTVSNGPYVGAAYTLAPDARVDDGLLDVVIFRGIGVLRMLVHLVFVAGGRRLPPPPGVQLVRARSVRVERPPRGRPLPVHADGAAVGVTPAHFEVLPAALRVIVGEPEPGALCAWKTPGLLDAVDDVDRRRDL